MCQDLREGNIDMAILLTEGAVKDISNNNPSQICSFYVDSPLIWGVHSSKNSPLTHENIDPETSFAISRFTSGSHLMAYVYASKLGIHLEETDFEVINNLEGAKKSLERNDNQLFLWEKYTTKPFVDSNEFKRIDECPTPWPAFVVVATEALIQKSPEAVEKVISIVQEQAKKLKSNPGTAALISSRYRIKLEDAKSWLSEVQWSVDISINEDILKDVSNVLKDLGLIDASENKKNRPRFLGADFNPTYLQ